MGGGPSFPVVALPKERTVIITGGNTGIGYEAAKHIAMMGATVIIACRSEQRAKDAIIRMNEEFKKEKESGQGERTQTDELNVEFMELDLASLKSTMKFINAFKSSGRSLHILLCNAGIALVPRGYTEDSYEKMFQINYLSHFLIISHLLPIMKESGDDCRIVFTSSTGHKNGVFDLEKAQANNESDYGRLKYYGNSKLYQIQHMFCLSRRLDGTNISVTSMHPGIVGTEIDRNYADMRVLHVSVRIGNALKLTRSPLQGATTLIDAAVNPKWKGVRGVYLIDCKPVTPSSDARNEGYQEELWKYSLKCLKEYLPDDVISGLEVRG